MGDMADVVGVADRPCGWYFLMLGSTIMYHCGNLIARTHGPSAQIDGHHIDIRGVSGLKVEKLDGMLKVVVLKPNDVYCWVAVQIDSNDLGDWDKTADSVAKEMLKVCVSLRDELRDAESVREVAGWVKRCWKCVWACGMS